MDVGGNLQAPDLRRWPNVALSDRPEPFLRISGSWLEPHAQHSLAVQLRTADQR